MKSKISTIVISTVGIYLTGVFVPFALSQDNNLCTHIRIDEILKLTENNTNFDQFIEKFDRLNIKYSITFEGIGINFTELKDHINVDFEKVKILISDNIVVNKSNYNEFEFLELHFDARREILNKKCYKFYALGSR